MIDYLNPRVADRLVRGARAAHTLSEALWEALHEELAAPEDGRRIAELSQRLADTATAVVLLAGRREREGTHGAHLPAEEAAGAPEATGAPGAAETPAAVETPAIQFESTPVEPIASARPAGPGSAEPPAREAGAGLRPLATLVDELAREKLETGVESEIHARDQRGTESRHAVEDPARHVREGGVEAESGEVVAATPWIASIARRVERYERDRQPFAVMAIELVDIERLRHTELPGEVARLTGLVETALAGELRPADSLMRESPGRYWLLAPETDPDGARALAERLAGAVRDAASHRGEPMQVAAGIAVCPADGLVAAALAAHADIGLYAARAAGRPLV